LTDFSKGKISNRNQEMKILPRPEINQDLRGLVAILPIDFLFPFG